MRASPERVPSGNEVSGEEHQTQYKASFALQAVTFAVGPHANALRIIGWHKNDLVGEA